MLFEVITKPLSDAETLSNYPDIEIIRRDENAVDKSIPHDIPADIELIPMSSNEMKVMTIIKKRAAKRSPCSDAATSKQCKLSSYVASSSFLDLPNSKNFIIECSDSESSGTIVSRTSSNISKSYDSAHRMMPSKSDYARQASPTSTIVHSDDKESYLFDAANSSDVVDHRNDHLSSTNDESSDYSSDQLQSDLLIRLENNAVTVTKSIIQTTSSTAGTTASSDDLVNSDVMDENVQDEGDICVEQEVTLSNDNADTCNGIDDGSNDEPESMYKSWSILQIQPDGSVRPDTSVYQEATGGTIIESCERTVALADCSGDNVASAPVEELEPTIQNLHSADDDPNEQKFTDAENYVLESGELSGDSSDVCREPAGDMKGAIETKMCDSDGMRSDMFAVAMARGKFMT